MSNKLAVTASATSAVAASVKPLQRLVSKNKRRLKQGGFDLDLTYVTDNIIAMGLPCTGRSALYRNPMKEVQRFLEQRHGENFKVYNLCTRPKDQYDPDCFGGRVACFPFEDHGVPALHTVDALARSVAEWLAPSPDRVVCIHCLAGKGRTGLMVCAALLRLHAFGSAREAMRFYGAKRMKNGKGVTQPSQRRYCEYFAQYNARRLSTRPALDLDRRVTLSHARLCGGPADGPPPRLSVRVLDAAGRVVCESGSFVEAEGGGGAACSQPLRCGLCTDFTVELCDEEGSAALASLCLHAAFVHAPLLRTTHRWWDVGGKTRAAAMRLLKGRVLELHFDDDGGFGGERLGATLAPTTDKPLRRSGDGDGPGAELPADGEAAAEAGSEVAVEEGSCGGGGGGGEGEEEDEEDEEEEEDEEDETWVSAEEGSEFEADEQQGQDQRRGDLSPASPRSPKVASAPGAGAPAP